MKKLCPNCGRAIDPEAKHCPYCHFNLMNNNETIVTVDVGLLGLKKDKADKSEKEVSTEEKSQPQQTIDQPKSGDLPAAKKSPRDQRWLKIVLALAAVLAVLVLVGAHHYSYQQQLTRIENNLLNGKAENIIASKPTTVTATSLQPVKNYYQKNPAAFKRLKKQLANKNNNGAIKIVKQGSYFLFFPRYVLRLPTYSLSVDNPYQHTTVLVNGKKYSKQRQVLPGQYQITTKNSYLSQSIQEEKTIDVLKDTSSQVKLNVKSFKIKSTPSGTAYLNNKAVGKLDKNGVIKFTDVAMNKLFSIYVAKKYKGKLIKTKTIKDVPAAVKKSTTLKLAWQTPVNIKALLERNFNNPKAGDFVKSSKNRSYQDLKQLDKGWNTSPGLKSYQASVTMKKKSLTDLEYLVKYTFNFKSGKRVQVMRFKRGTAKKTSDGLKINSIGSGSITSSK